jgi:hypothetical protein
VALPEGGWAVQAPIVRGAPLVAVSPDTGGAKRVARFREELQLLIQHFDDPTSTGGRGCVRHGRKDASAS